jgi:hypothetical protein
MSIKSRLEKLEHHPGAAKAFKVVCYQEGLGYWINNNRHDYRGNIDPDYETCTRLTQAEFDEMKRSYNILAIEYVKEPYQKME